MAATEHLSGEQLSRAGLFQSRSLQAAMAEEHFYQDAPATMSTRVGSGASSFRRNRGDPQQTRIPVPAEEHLSKRQFLYHEAHLNDRESIRSEGLRPSVPYMASDLPKGVYMAPLSHSEYGSSMNDASHFGYDRWRVDVTGLDLHVDKSQPSVTKFHPEHVHPSRLRLVKKGHPNWQQHI